VSAATNLRTWHVTVAGAKGESTNLLEAMSRAMPDCLFDAKNSLFSGISQK